MDENDIYYIRILYDKAFKNIFLAALYDQSTPLWTHDMLSVAQMRY